MNSANSYHIPPDMEQLQSTPGGTTVEMIQKPTSFPSFLGRRSFVPRPISNATDFFDLDDESDAGDSPRSLASLDNGSESTVSSQGLKTPQSAGLGAFEFHFDDRPISGPMVFQPIPEESKDFTPELLPSAKPHARPVTALNQAVAELDESQVRSWRPEQVAEWMAEAGFETSVVDKFLIHDISGAVLIDLQFEDLKELDISSFGKRHRVMSSIQQLRDSALITEPMLSRTSSKNATAPRASRTLTRGVAPAEREIVAESRSRSRRRGRRANDSSEVTPAESASIVAIEQLLPKPHKCSKGEDCAKYQKYLRKVQRIQEEFAADVEAAQGDEQKSEILPSVVGSSDVLGPTPAFKITAERLNEVQVRDTQESIRQFVQFQHVNNSASHGPSPPPASSASFAARATPTLSEHLRGLPRLTIPAEHSDTPHSHRTPMLEFSNPTAAQSQLKEQLRNDPYHYGGVASPADIYRTDTPMSANDIPVTMHAADPIGERFVSQSVPPEMRYGGPSMWTTSGEPVERCQSTAPAARRRMTRHMFEPKVTPVHENFASLSPAQRKGHVSTDVLAHEGWMRKRRTNRTIRHNEWTDNYFRLSGNRLVMLESEQQQRRATAGSSSARRDTLLETIDVDNYAVHAYSVATSSKLSAAIKKSVLGAGYMTAEPSFAFSLIPEHEGTKKGSGRKTNTLEKQATNKAHHFAVRSGPEKVEWMRRLMLAKAASRNGSGSYEF